MSVIHPILKAVLVWLVACLSYYLAGLFGLDLAIPPGFASAIWPASGVALALAILLSWKWVVLGVFCGSLMVNLGQVLSGEASFEIALLYLPSTIGLGASLQLLFGYVLFKYLIGVESQINTPRQILYFSLIVAPISCLIASSFGAGGLFYYGIIEREQTLFTWFTWWIGDTIGILLFTPMLLVLFSKNNNKLSNKRKAQVVIPSVVIFVFSYLLFMWSQESRLHKIENILDDYANYYSQKIHESLLLSENKLKAYQAFFQGSNSISFEEFNEFSKVMLDKDSILHGVGWTEVIPHEKRVETEKRIQRQGFLGFQFTRPETGKGMVTIEKKDIYYPVLYIYPLERNKQAMGLDLSSLSGRLELLENIANDGQARATSPIQLVQESDSIKATILYLPVWEKYPENTKLIGYVSGVYLFNGIVAPIINQALDTNINIDIDDVTDETVSSPLINSKASSHSVYSSVIKDVLFGNRVYKITFTPTSQFNIGEKDWVSWLILISGFLLSALLQAFILMMTGTIEYTSRIVEERTKQLSLATKKAEKASEAKSMFLANMSHELRTPLNAIVGLINLCLKTNLNKTQSQYLNQSKLASETLVLLINQTLDYAKIESGNLELESIEFDLSKMIAKLHAIFLLRSEEKGIEFILGGDQKLPENVIGDALRLEQVLLNLLSNAFKFTDQGRVTLWLGFEKFNDRTTLLITVKDTGVGIPKHLQKNLFQSFRQADNSTTRKFGGTGLGLAISKQIIQLMNGTVELFSDEGEGCEFVVRIPVEMVAGSKTFDVESLITVSHDMAQLTIDESEVISKPLKGIDILLVEDIEMNRMIATELLEFHGANVTQAVDGQNALNTLQNAQNIDLILMDIQMPVLDGYGATEKIRKIKAFKHLPIIAMTANAMNEDIEKCHSVGMNAHIGKPIDEKIMLNTILSVLTGATQE